LLPEKSWSGFSTEFFQKLKPFSDILPEIMKKFPAGILLTLMENKDKDFVILSRLGNMFFKRKERFNMNNLKAGGTECIYWSRERDLNPRPDDYESTALPTELSRL
jgi:hypothetical protein